jgi:hypothetical protein
MKKKRNKTHREIMKENKDLFRKKVKKIKNENLSLEEENSFHA